MTELYLKYLDATGEEKRVPVGAATFVIGRHSASDLAIPDGRLSREHLKIEKLGDEVFVTDLGSSNGTKLNGERLDRRCAIGNGDTLSLGGLILEFEIASDEPGANGTPPQPDEVESDATADPGPQSSAAGASAAARPMKPAGPDKGGFSFSLLLIAPVLGILILAMAGGLLFLLGGKRQPEIVSADNDFQYSTVRDREDAEEPQGNIKRDPPANAGTNAAPITSANSSGSISSSDDTSPPPVNVSETAKIEQASASFLRRIAHNDPRAFLTTEQAKRVGPKIRQLNGSSGLAENINSARKNADKIRQLAASKNLKPQLLAVAALAKMGSARGDVVQAASGLADVLDKLSTQIGNELADDALLLIAAYDQGAGGDFMRMRNMLQELANKYPESARAIRSVWFLEKNQKITSAEFERSLVFLAVGTITQNPREFGVNAEPLTL